MPIETLAGLTFEPSTHEYRFRGRPAVSVTAVLKHFGIKSLPDIRQMPEYLARGQAFHSEIEALVCGRFDATVADAGSADHIDRVAAWVEARGQFVTEAVEVAQCASTSTGYLIAGRWDWVGQADGLRTIIDWKRGPVTVGDCLQMCGYRWMAQQCGIDIEDGLVVSAASDPVHVVRPTAHAALVWQTLMRLYGADDRPLGVWGTVVT